MFDGAESPSRARVTDLKLAGDSHAVATIEGGGASYRRQPCAKCPWRRDAVGVFPADAFRHSGITGASGASDDCGTAYAFACHSTGAQKPATCAGYILRDQGSKSWKRAFGLGKFDPALVSDGGVSLFGSYREMAEANGVPPDDPAIAMCAPRAALTPIFVQPLDLVIWADRIRPQITKMADGSGGRYEPADLFAAIAAGRMQLWVAVHEPVVECVLLGQIQYFPRMRVMRLIGLVGRNPRRWASLLEVVEDQAKRQFGCVRMESLHRPRFLSLLRGYFTTHWLSEKVL